MNLNPGKPIPGQSTKVTLLLSSSANDRLSAFQLGLVSVTLTNMVGNSVTVYQQPTSPSPSQLFVEAMHTNGAAEPLATASIPQDVYISATVAISSAQFAFVTFDANAKTITYIHDETGPNLATTVALPSPVTISGNAVTLSLDLQVSKSVSVAGPPPAAFSITPVFNMTPIMVTPQPTNNQNGKTSSIHGRVASINATGNVFSLALPDGPTLSLTSDSNTVFQGIGAFSALTTGMFVDIDSVIQADGSLRATRVEVEDSAAHDVMLGQLTQVVVSVPVLDVLDRQHQGDDFSFPPDPVGMSFQWDSNTVFRTSGQFPNLQSLPFTATFNAANMVTGQNVSIASATFAVGFPFTTATTITLVPQTINGTVSAVSTGTSFTVYSVTLAPNDLIPTLTGTASVVAYADGNTQVITSSPIGVGSVVRFNGLLFNDSGTLRLVAGQASDGVAP